MRARRHAVADRRDVTGDGPRAPEGGQASPGQASVELALALPLVALLLLAVLQVALVARDVVLVGHAGREAARAAAVGEDPTTAARASGGLDPKRLRVTVRGGRRSGARADVEVTYRIPTDLAFVGRLLPELPVHTTVRARIE